MKSRTDETYPKLHLSFSSGGIIKEPAGCILLNVIEPIKGVNLERCVWFGSLMGALRKRCRLRFGLAEGTWSTSRGGGIASWFSDLWRGLTSGFSEITFPAISTKQDMKTCNCKNWVLLNNMHTFWIPFDVFEQISIWISKHRKKCPSTKIQGGSETGHPGISCPFFLNMQNSVNLTYAICMRW